MLIKRDLGQPPLKLGPVQLFRLQSFRDCPGAFAMWLSLSTALFHRVFLLGARLEVTSRTGITFPPFPVVTANFVFLFSSLPSVTWAIGIAGSTLIANRGVYQGPFLSLPYTSLLPL